MAITTYIDAKGIRKTGYTKDGKIYADAIGKTPVGTGSIVADKGQQYSSGLGNKGASMLYSDFLKGKSTKQSGNTGYISLSQHTGMDEGSPYALQLQKNEEDTRNLITELNESYGDANTQLYRDYMSRKKNMPQQLSAQGITGGLSETSLLGLEAGYQDALGQNERARLAGIRDIEAAGNSNKLTIMENYQKDQETRAREEAEKAARRAETMGSVGDFSGYKALGYSDEEIARMQADWDRKKASEVAEVLASAGDFSGYKALGYTDEQVATMEAAYNRGDMAMIAEVMASIGDFSGYKALGFTDEQIAALKAAWDAQFAPQTKYVYVPGDQPPKLDDDSAGAGVDLAGQTITSDNDLGSFAKAANKSLANAAEGGPVQVDAVIEQIIRGRNAGKITAEEVDYLLNKYNLG